MRAPTGGEAPGPPAGPVRSADDTDLGWGEAPASAAEVRDEGAERLVRERPPHWG